MKDLKTVATDFSVTNRIPTNNAREYISDMLQEMETMAEALDMKDVSILLKMTINLMNSETFVP